MYTSFVQATLRIHQSQLGAISRVDYILQSERPPLCAFSEGYKSSKFQRNSFKLKNALAIIEYNSCKNSIALPHALVAYWPVIWETAQAQCERQSW